MVTLKRDKKAHDTWMVTVTDSEGLHRQLPISFDDMRELVRLWIEETIRVTLSNAERTATRNIYTM